MRTPIASCTLKTGETLDIELVQAPDADRQNLIRPFLGHKPDNYRAHINAALAGECDSLETRFYIGLIGSEMVGNIMTVEHGGFGILGHVHTREDHRRKGICDAIMSLQIQDFKLRGGRTLLLGTGYRSAAYHIYEKFGFRDWPGGPQGCMRFDAPGAGDWQAGLRSGSRAAAARWSHWPHVAMLASLPTPYPLRSVAMGSFGIGLLEGPYCTLMEKRSRAGGHIVVLETEAGAVSALASLLLDERWPGVLLLDLFAHPDVGEAELIALLSVLPLKDHTTSWHVDPDDSVKIGAALRTGFARKSVVHGMYEVNGSRRDALLLQRR